MLPEYDFSGGVRGKYAKRYAEGTNLVLLEPDLAAAFPDSESVSRALRAYLKSPIFDYFVVALVLKCSCMSIYIALLRASSPRNNSKLGLFRYALRDALYLSRKHINNKISLFQTSF